MKKIMRNYLLIILIISVISVLIMGCDESLTKFCTDYGNGVYVLDIYASDNLNSEGAFHTLGNSLVKFLNEHPKLKITDVERHNKVGTYIVITDSK